ncbi:hypothetical protein NRF20_02375 [Streptomyces sp. R-74717]|uniref:hypothetical protein n=1 Tax=Streptomyces TaxID=1883 RepID=UPI0037944B60
MTSRSSRRPAAACFGGGEPAAHRVSLWQTAATGYSLVATTASAQAITAESATNGAKVISLGIMAAPLQSWTFTKV